VGLQTPVGQTLVTKYSASAVASMLAKCRLLARQA
jgi:hypothetical protein